MTPYDMHYGLAQAKWKQRAQVLRAAYAAHPERFPRGNPLPPPLPTAAWINKPLGRDVPPKTPTDQAAEAVAFSPARVIAPDGGGS